MARLKKLQREVHAAFIDLVKSRRTRLADDPEIFTGAFWSGAGAVKLGLADRVGDLATVLREKFGDDVVMKTIGDERGFLRRRLGLSARPPLAASLIEGAVAIIEERLLWSRFGL